jgi:hypothetical protein
MIGGRSLGINRWHCKMSIQSDLSPPIRTGGELAEGDAQRRVLIRLASPSVESRVAPAPRATNRSPIQQNEFRTYSSQFL